MPDYHPDAELAPRDVVSRSIALHLAATGAPADSPVYLDARGIEAARGAGFLARRFPTINAATRAAGYDWTAEPLPVSPAAHYWMGGVATDVWARTSVPGLYAAGEVACTGVQGANRLASNSLLEGLVFGRRAVQAFLRQPAPWTGWRARAGVTAAVPRAVPAGTAHGVPDPDPAPGEAAVPFSREALGRLMTVAAGVMRTGAELDAAAGQLDRWAAGCTGEGRGTLDQPLDQAPGRAGHEDRNLLLAARLLVAAARKRSVSAGAHYRADTASSQSEDRQAAGTFSMQRI
jgi:L-aspartate oxidase